MKYSVAGHCTAQTGSLVGGIFTVRWLCISNLDQPPVGGPCSVGSLHQRMNVHGPSLVVLKVLIGIHQFFALLLS